MKIHCLSLKAEDDEIFKNRSKKSYFLPRPLKSMLKSEVDRLSLQHLEYEIDCADITDDYHFKNRILCLPYLPSRTYSTQASH